MYNKVPKDKPIRNEEIKVSSYKDNCEKTEFLHCNQKISLTSEQVRQLNRQLIFIPNTSHFFIAGPSPNKNTVAQDLLAKMKDYEYSDSFSPG